MTSETLHNALEQNRENLKALLDALEADYELPEDPEKKARLASHFGTPQERVKEASMTEAERTAWLFEQNAKALEAATEAAAARGGQTPTVAESEGMRGVKAFLGGGQ